jgi:hypothetical protein
VVILETELVARSVPDFNSPDYSLDRGLVLPGTG